MRIFVTGATGYVGSAVVRDLLDHGHQVLGLARSEESAAKLSALGVNVHRGDVEDLDSLRTGAAAADGVIYAAFTIISESVDRAATIAAESRAVQAIGETLYGTGKPLILTSGTLGLPLGRLGTEDSPTEGTNPRGRLAEEVVAMAAQGVRSGIVRLAPTVHGEGDRKGFIRELTRIAREKGVSAYVGKGLNRWPAVHRRDAAQLFRLAAEKGAAGSRWHAAAEEGVPFREIAEAIGRQQGVPAVSIDDPGEHFGFLGPIVPLDNPTSSALTRELLGWQPTGATLLDDIASGIY